MALFSTGHHQIGRLGNSWFLIRECFWIPPVTWYDTVMFVHQIGMAMSGMYIFTNRSRSKYNVQVWSIAWMNSSLLESTYLFANFHSYSFPCRFLICFLFRSQSLFHFSICQFTCAFICKLIQKILLQLIRGLDHLWQRYWRFVRLGKCQQKMLPLQRLITVVGFWIEPVGTTSLNW